VKGGVLFAAAAGMIEASLEVPHGGGVLPAEDRLRGEHIGGSMADDIGSVTEAIDGRKKEKSVTAEKAEPAVKRPAAKDKDAGKADKKPAKAPADKKVKEAE